MLATALASTTAMAQMGGMAMPPANPAAGPAVEVQRSYAGLKVNILKSAELMPEDSYGFMPTPEVRKYARILNHITEAQVGSCGMVNGTPAAERVKTPTEADSKATIIAALKASFAECDKAYGSATDANFAEMLTAGSNKRSRAGVLWGNVSHDNEQYSALAMYLRLKNITPPSSEK